LKSDKQLTIKIDGGLGNQLFQLYAGLYFANHLNLSPLFDISRLRKINKLHPGMNISTLGLLNQYETKNRPLFLSPDLSARLIRKINLVLKQGLDGSLRGIPEKVHSDIGYVEIEKIQKLPNVIQGYFQTWRYFDELQEKPIISYQTLRNPSAWLNQNIVKIQETNPLIMHVRRGDYLQTKNKETGLLSLKYFEAVCRAHGEETEIWVLTDSPSLVKEEFRNFPRRFRILTPPIDSDPVESMILMSRAKALAISNSTFSWWAAKLATPGSSVYSPSKWFQHRTDPTDLLPTSWVKIESDWAKD
jgi:hypothetical protein